MTDFLCFSRVTQVVSLSFGTPLFFLAYIRFVFSAPFSFLHLLSSFINKDTFGHLPPPYHRFIHCPWLITLHTQHTTGNYSTLYLSSIWIHGLEVAEDVGIVAGGEATITTVTTTTIVTITLEVTAVVAFYLD
jgi:hypothetical protein